MKPLTRSLLLQSAATALCICLGSGAAGAEEPEKFMIPVSYHPETLVGKITKANAPTLVITPQLIVELLETDNLDLALARNTIQQAKWENRATIAPLLPSIQGQFSAEKFDGGEVIIDEVPLEIKRTTLRPRLSLDYEVHTGFKPLVEWKKTRVQLKRAQTGYDRASQEALLKAMEQYFTWMRDFSNVQLAQQSFEESKSQWHHHQQRLATGFGTELEVHQSGVQVSERHTDVLKQHSHQLFSGLELANTLNIPVQQHLLPDSPIIRPIDFWEPTQTLPELMELAEANRPNIKELACLVREAKLAVWSSVSDMFPKVQIGAFIGGVGPTMPDLQRNTQQSLRMNVDLLRHLGLDTYSQIQINRTHVEEAILKKEKELNKIKSSLAKAYFDWTLYQGQIQDTKMKVQSAQEAYRITQARQDLGFGINLEVVQAKTKLDEARQEYLTAVMNYNVSQLQLLFETGQLSPQRVLAPYTTATEISKP